LIFEAIKKILEGEKKGKQAEVCRATNLTPFWILFRVEAVLLEEIKHQSLCTIADAPPCPSESEEKDILESKRLKAVENLQK
jgi:hypothetical protein